MMNKYLDDAMALMRWTCCHNIFRLELFGVTNLMHGSPRKAHDRLGDGTGIRRGLSRPLIGQLSPSWLLIGSRGASYRPSYAHCNERIANIYWPSFKF